MMLRVRRSIELVGIRLQSMRMRLEVSARKPIIMIVQKKIFIS